MKRSRGPTRFANRQNVSQTYKRRIPRVSEESLKTFKTGMRGIGREMLPWSVVPPVDCTGQIALEACNFKMVRGRMRTREFPGNASLAPKMHRAVKCKPGKQLSRGDGLPLPERGSNISILVSHISDDVSRMCVPLTAVMGGLPGRGRGTSGDVKGTASSTVASCHQFRGILLVYTRSLCVETLATDPRARIGGNV
jgi:hypothetical protein